MIVLSSVLKSHTTFGVKCFVIEIISDNGDVDTIIDHHHPLRSCFFRVHSAFYSKDIRKPTFIFILMSEKAKFIHPIQNVYVGFQIQAPNLS